MAVKILDTGMVAIIRHNGMYFPVRATSFNVTQHADGRATISLAGQIEVAFAYEDLDEIADATVVLSSSPRQIAGTVACREVSTYRNGKFE
jgi:hypothetical protein